MTEAEILRTIRQAVRQELAPILMAQVTSTKDATRASASRFATDTPQDGLRNLSPYGLASRPPSGMQCLLVPIAGDPTNQTVAGHFDPARPALDEGEVALYGPAGQILLYKSDGSTYQGAGASEPVVLGKVLAEAVTMILKAFTDAPTLGTDSMQGPVVLSPAIVAKLQQYLSKYVTSDATNFLSGTNFVER